MVRKGFLGGAVPLAGHCRVSMVFINREKEIKYQRLGETWVGKIPGVENGNLFQYSRKFHGQRSLVGYSPWGCKELKMTEQACTGEKVSEWGWWNLIALQYLLSSLPL